MIKKLIASVVEKIDSTKPSPYKLADEQDEDGWDRNKHGLMADAGTPDDTIETVPYEADK